METKLLKRWVKALRSRMYKQGKNELKQVAEPFIEYCCLGVLRHIVDPKDNRQNRNGGFLTPTQLRVFGLSHEWQEHLGRMNDGAVNVGKRSFGGIAQFLEKLGGKKLADKRGPNTQ